MTTDVCKKCTVCTVWLCLGTHNHTVWESDTDDLTTSLNGSPDTCWSFVWVPLYRRVVETVEDFRENNRQYRTAAHNAAPAIRQIIWRLADWGQPPREVKTLLTLEGGLGWKCVSLAPCCVWQGTLLLSEVLLWPVQSQLLFSLSEVYLRASLSSGLVPLSRWHTQTDVQPLGFLVGSCKPPVCSGLYSYEGPTVMAVQVPYTC